MISFRYHVVSLAAVLLALAAGVLLGSGPLQGRLTTSSPDGEGVSAAAALADLQGAEETVVALAASASVDSLAGQTVAVVALPGAHQDDVAAVRQSLGAAGAAEGADVTIDFSNADAAYLQTFTGQIAGYLATPPADAAPEAIVMAAVLAVLTGQDTSNGVLPELLEAGDRSIVTMSEAEVSTAVVAVGPREASEWNLAAMARALDPVPAVLLGATTPAGDGLVDALRADEPIPTTVNEVDTKIGPALVPLALAADIVGESGHWGPGQMSPSPPLVR